MVSSPPQTFCATGASVFFLQSTTATSKGLATVKNAVGQQEENTPKNIPGEIGAGWSSGEEAT
jgi:hypothetical protein